ncbi:MAG: aspartate/glutamate racemase family protein [Proteobacteria bacterium]|nr:aspartate/glutamate racemase family protein [Pseudomonadota bacterium]
MREKTIGILGGMGPEATLLMFAKILENTPAAKDQEHLRMIIYNNPKIPERLPAILGVGENPVPVMVESGLSLIKAGADFIVIPCISAHFFYKTSVSSLIFPSYPSSIKPWKKLKTITKGCKQLGF